LEREFYELNEKCEKVIVEKKDLKNKFDKLTS